jgi:hypothetical protein
MAPFRLDDESAPTVQLLSSRRPTKSLRRLLARRFPRGASAENVRIRFGLRTALDLRRITPADVAEFEQLDAEEKGVLDMLRQVSEAHYKTHLCLDYGLPAAQARDRAHAEALLDDFCGRMVEWGRAKFGGGTREWQILDLLQSINSMLKDGDMARFGGIIEDFQAVAVPDNQIGLRGYSLKFEVEGEFVLYDIREIVGFLKRFAGTTLYAPVEIGSNDLANMQTLLGRLHKYIG